MPETKYIATSTELEGIADAIREKGGTSASLVYPAGFISAIDGIQSGSSSLKSISIRPDAEVVKTWSRDYHIVEDDDVTIPAYTTTATTLQASTSLSNDTFDVDPENYCYVLTLRALAIPEYSTQTRGAGSCEYSITCGYAELVTLDDQAATSIDGAMVTSGYTHSFTSVNTTARTVSHGSTFYGGNMNLVVATSSSGVYCTLNAPTYSSTKRFTAKTPTVYIRGSSSYFTQTYYEAMTDARIQYVIQVWRAPKTDGIVNGWQLRSQLDHVNNCIKNNNCKLT